MAAYVIVEMAITDPVAIEEYRRLAGASVAQYGGRFIVRGGRLEYLEGGWEPERIVVLEFPDAARARAWWSSPEYAAARVIRERAARTRMVLVEGVA
ncbi:MAG TPA: DUF1330 domain-containing protein [Burkholderiales bacterium]|nr:DUF1330 domain-containing protein [Burkholderiales bacterium]